MKAVEKKEEKAIEVCPLCGSKLQGTLQADQWFKPPEWPQIPHIIWSRPIADITITIYIPWFLRG